jgi:hypothetical protein
MAVGVLPCHEASNPNTVTEDRTPTMSSQVSQQHEQHDGPQHVHEKVDTVAILAASTLCHER